METTGEITVLTGNADDPPPDRLVMLGVRDAERLR